MTRMKRVFIFGMSKTRKTQNIYHAGGPAVDLVSTGSSTGEDGTFTFQHRVRDLPGLYTVFLISMTPLPPLR